MTDEEKRTEMKLHDLIKKAELFERLRCVKIIERRAIEMMRKRDANSKLLFELANEVRDQPDSSVP